MPSTYLERILKARVYELIRETPLEPAARLSARLGHNVLIKREDLHDVFSFKIRGAYNKLAGLSRRARDRGVVAASAGNHAQGVAMSAQHLGITARIVMPVTTPLIKVDAVRASGAETILHGDTYNDAYDLARQLSRRDGMTFVHPYDDRDVIAGQGTVAMEILRQHKGDIHAIFVPVGGGGLIAGVSAYIKTLYPGIRIIGVEPDDAACLHAALAAGRRVRLKQVGIFVDGAAVKQVGREPFRIAQQCVDEVIRVDTDETCAAIKDIFDDTRSIAEPAGALAVAGMKRYVAARPRLQAQTLIAIDSGANMNFDRLRYVAERAELGEHVEALLAVTIPERPGSFLALCRLLGRVGVTEFNYRYRHADIARVFIGVGTQGGEVDVPQIVQSLGRAGFPVVDMSHNEMAKTHVRFMIGGTAPELSHELLYHFDFPERPGALMEFLTAIGDRWSITLFHYRNHGAAWGRVLAGFIVPPAERAEFRRRLATLRIVYTDVTHDPALQLFLGDG